MASTAIAERQETRPANPLVVLRHELEQRAGEFKMALPAHITPERFQRTIITAVQSNAKLLQADRRSFITSCMKAAQDGLLPDGREAALVEFKTRQQVNGVWQDVRMVQYMPMVYGLRKKILQSGEVKDIFASIVYRQEVDAGLFIYEEGTERTLRHKPLLDPEFDPKDEDIVAAYSIATFTDGSQSFEVMRRSDINKVRNVSQTGALYDRKGAPRTPSGPWVDWFSEQAKKSVIRRHSKTLPMSGDIVDVEAMDDMSAARSATALLGAVAEEPAQLSAPRRGDSFDDYVEVPHDEETGEVIDAKAEEKPKPARARKAKDEPRQDTATQENPAATEGPADEQRGEDHTDEHPAQRAADAIKAEAATVAMIPDLSSLKARAKPDLDAMPDDMRAEVEAAFSAAETRLRGAK